MEGRFQMISSNLEGFKFPQLTSVLIASFSLIITIILSPRTWERNKHLLLVSGFMMANSNKSIQMLPQPNDEIVFQPVLQFCFPCDVLGQMTDAFPPLFCLFLGVAVWAMGSSYLWDTDMLHSSLYSIIWNNIKSWHLLASWTVWAQWRKNDALASIEDVSWYRYY